MINYNVKSEDEEFGISQENSATVQLYPLFEALINVFDKFVNDVICAHINIALYGKYTTDDEYGINTVRYAFKIGQNDASLFAIEMKRVSIDARVQMYNGKYERKNAINNLHIGFCAKENAGDYNIFLTKIYENNGGTNANIGDWIYLREYIYKNDETGNYVYGAKATVDFNVPMIKKNNLLKYICVNPNSSDLYQYAVVFGIDNYGKDLLFGLKDESNRYMYYTDSTTLYSPILLSDISQTVMNKENTALLYNPYFKNAWSISDDILCIFGYDIYGNTSWRRIMINGVKYTQLKKYWWIEDNE